MHVIVAYNYTSFDRRHRAQPRTTQESAKNDSRSHNQAKQANYSLWFIDIEKNSETLGTEVDTLKTQVKILVTENKALRKKLSHLEDQSRRNNVVIYDLDEAEGPAEESWDETEEKVIQNIQKVLDIDIDKVSIERAHRVGKRTNDTVSEYTERAHSASGAGVNKQDGGAHKKPTNVSSQVRNTGESVKPRPIVCKFTSWKMRNKVLKAARAKAKERREAVEEEQDFELTDRPTAMKIAEDYSAEMRSHRKKLVDILVKKKEKAKAEGNEGFKCFLRYDKLVINDVPYTLNEKGDLVTVKQ